MIPNFVLPKPADMPNLKTYLTLPALLFIFVACNNADKEKETEKKEPYLVEEMFGYTADSVTMDGMIVYDENIKEKRPAILVIHEWWGFNDYTKMRARELAKLGYIAMAMDMYGNGVTTDTVPEAQRLSMLFYSNLDKAKTRMDAAFAKLMAHPMADTSKTAVIGYCFGGSMALNFAMMGANLDGAVSFHGILPGGAPAIKDMLKAKILICHGGADPFVPEVQVNQFKKEMDSIGADYSFKVYEGASHAFTNPAATEMGKKNNIPIIYHPAADSASWNDMKAFFNKIFN
jgi:dienelactone hydrolase